MGGGRDRGPASVLHCPGVRAVLFRLWAGKGSASPVELAGQLLGLIAAELPGRRLHGVGDAACHGKPLLVAGTTWTTLLPANAALYDLAPPRTGRRGRPALKGAGLGRPAAVAARVADWEKVTVARYGRTESVFLAEVPCIWYGGFGNTVGRCVLVRDDGSVRPYDLALFTVDTTATAAGVVGRYAVRWSIEPANATSKQQTGVGQARNRVPKAVERTVPFGMLVQTLVIIWYALHGYQPEDVLARRLAEPWYDSKTEPSFEDMIVKLRRTLIAARFTAVRPGHVRRRRLTGVARPRHRIENPHPAKPPRSVRMPGRRRFSRRCGRIRSCRRAATSRRGW